MIKVHLSSNDMIYNSFYGEEMKHIGRNLKVWLKKLIL